MANRLSFLLLSLIHKDQVGFVPTRYTGNNTRRTIDLIDLLTKIKRPAIVLSLDAHKAFNCLNWSFVFAILSRYGFSGPFIQALRALYSSSTDPNVPTENASKELPTFYMEQCFP